MGNCLKLKPMRTWVEDDEEDEDCYMKQCKEEEIEEKEKMVKAGQTTMITGEKQRIVARSNCSTKVKIKLTKKQFEELMELVEIHGLQIEQALISHQFISKNNIDVVHSNESHTFGCQRVPWRPVLQCIPEEC